jgi:hypothetical protein
MDTVLVSFDTHPMDLDINWPQSGLIHRLTGNTYFYKPAYGVFPLSVGFIPRPENYLTDTRLDSIVIFPLHSAKAGDRCYFEPEPGPGQDMRWRCFKIFTGRFVNRDLIEGELRFGWCDSHPSDTPPDSVFLTFPATFHRLN